MFQSLGRADEVSRVIGRLGVKYINGRIISEDRSRKMPVRLARREGIPSDERSGLNVHTKMERKGLLDDNLARYHRLFYTSCTIR